ncbi:RluA family pseudouridine synthase [Lentilactobacillus raoultii]|uniref:Pseudouridine synthase n=1 Tax=Lentilactobacillus raoultii TaxID=1987503 RepID=A0ABW3PMK1_9LACO|nr:RluA family pseudouridine synthase [Lentilactobacillus raoultii]
MKFTWQKQQTDPKTIKKFLKLHGISHRMYKEIKTAGQILVNHQPSQPEELLKDGDQVTVVLPTETSDPNVAVSEQPIKVVYEDDNWLVVDKEAGLTVVPGPANRKDTLVNRVKGYLKRQGAVDLVPHIITRLDRFTSGLVLVAKHRLANSLANDLLAKKQIDKRYLAIVSGTGLPSHGRIQKPIAKDPNGFGQIISEAGRLADTEYWVRQQLTDRTLVAVVLHTGRTHQIRVHFASIGHPLLGDHLYHGPMNLGINRQALHAAMLGFEDPFSHQEIKLELPMPGDMKTVLD